MYEMRRIKEKWMETELDEKERKKTSWTESWREKLKTEEEKVKKKRAE